MNTSKVLKVLKEYGIITLGLLLFVVGWSVFLVPNNLVGGGVTGLASIIQYATKGVIKVGYSYFVINTILLVLALFALGKGFGGKTIYAIVFASLSLTFAESVIPQEIVQALAIDNGKLLSVIMGGIIVGLGIGLTMSQGGSTGGTDIIALIINKYRNVSPGTVIYMIDVVIILSSFFIPSYTSSGEKMAWTEKFTTMIYGFALVFITSQVLDFYLSGYKQSVQLFILSKKYSEIADAITHDLHHGVTVMDGKGWYTQQSTEVLMVIIRKSDLNIVLRTIKSIDQEAFLSVDSVNAVYGKGFEKIKQSIKK